MKFFAVLLMLLPLLANAQNDNKFMYSSGRIYVVIAVILIILFGLILYLVRLEKKVKQLENNKS